MNEEMEMPTTCQYCGETFDLNDGYGSEKWYPDTVICESCYEKEKEQIEEDEEIEELKIQISDAEIDLKNWKRRLGELTKPCEIVGPKGITTDRNDPRLKAEVNETEGKQNKVYLVLSEKERAEGFVRPIRDSYIHKGRYYENKPVMLEKPRIFKDIEHVATIPSLVKEGKVIGSAFLTQKELDQWQTTGGYIGGCMAVTKMFSLIAESYAKNPKFYTSTFCIKCRGHLPVREFVWAGTEDKVGS